MTGFNLDYIKNNAAYANSLLLMKYISITMSNCYITHNLNIYSRLVTSIEIHKYGEMIYYYLIYIKKNKQADI